MHVVFHFCDFETAKHVKFSFASVASNVCTSALVHARHLCLPVSLSENCHSGWSQSEIHSDLCKRDASERRAAFPCFEEKRRVIKMTFTRWLGWETLLRVMPIIPKFPVLTTKWNKMRTMMPWYRESEWCVRYSAAVVFLLRFLWKRREGYMYGIWANRGSDLTRPLVYPLWMPPPCQPSTK